MNEETEWDHGIEATVKEGSADCIRIDEVAAALKKMKRHKALCLSGLVAEMIQSTGDIGTQWILDYVMELWKTGFVQTVKTTFQDFLRLAKTKFQVFQDSQNSFQGLSRINSVHKHGCIRSKKCTYQISYRCNCITVSKPLQWTRNSLASSVTASWLINNLHQIQYFMFTAQLLSALCTVCTRSSMAVNISIVPALLLDTF